MHTPVDAIKLYLDIRDNRLKKLNEAYNREKAELEAAMAALEGFLLKTMQDRGEKQIKTDFGVAFQAPQERVKMVDRAAVIDYVHRSGDFSLFTNHVSKDGVKSFIEGHGAHPPGIEVTTFVTCNVRKS